MIRQLGTTALGVHRATLHRTLREALPASSLHTFATVQHVESGPDRAEVHYQGPDGTHTLSADLVVGADGLRSRVRAQLWPQHPGPVYAGSTTWRRPSPFPTRSRPPSPGGRGPSSAWCRSATASSTGTAR